MMNNTGILVQIIGAVVDADFSQAETLPALLNALAGLEPLEGGRVVVGSTDVTALDEAACAR